MMEWRKTNENDGMKENDAKDGENKECTRNKVNKSMVEMDQKGILAREYRRLSVPRESSLPLVSCSLISPV